MLLRKFFRECSSHQIVVQRIMEKVLVGARVATEDMKVARKVVEFSLEVT